MAPQPSSVKKCSAFQIKHQCRALSNSAWYTHKHDDDDDDDDDDDHHGAKGDDGDDGGGGDDVMMMRVTMI